MKTLNVKQGESDWSSVRAKYPCSSEAPVVMGASKHMTRGELLRLKSAGLDREFSDYMQRMILDKGHEVEALARVITEDQIGEALFPVTAVSDDDEYLASFDGITMLEETIFEHKQWNDELAAAVRAGATELPGGHEWQLEQQLLVAQDAEGVIFVCSDGTEERRVQMEYRRVPGRAEQLKAGWRQFYDDLAAGVAPPEPPKAVAAPMESLPAVSVRVDGSLAVVSNLPKFGELLRAFISKIPAKPTTDQEFADAEASCKALKRAEEALEAAEAGALGQIASVEEMTRMVADLRNLARTTRLASEKMVEARKTQIRTEQVQRGKDALAEHIAALNARLGKPYMPAIAADFAGAIKGKKTVQSLKDGIDTELARVKIEASAIADHVQANLTTLREQAANHAFLFADVATIVLKANDDLQALVKSRIADHEAAEAKRMEAERERIRAEEAAKMEREQAARAEQEWQAAARAELEAAERFAKHHQAVANVVQMPTPQEATSRILAARLPEVQKTPPTLKLGQIGERLGFSLSGEFLKKLGFEPAARDKAELLFHESQFQLICVRLVTHISHVQAKQEA